MAHKISTSFERASLHVSKVADTVVEGQLTILGGALVNYVWNIAEKS